MVAELDAAQRALLSTVPTSRDVGIPLNEALNDFLSGLARADALMPAWRTSKTEQIWLRCAEAIGQSRAEAERLRDENSALGFEMLNARLGDVIAPLEELADAAPEIRQLR